MVKCKEECIKEAAYYIWQNEGCPCGCDENIWARAVAQIEGCKSACKSSAKKSTTKAAAKKAPVKKASASVKKSTTSTKKATSKVSVKSL